MLREIRIEGDYMMAGWGFADVFSADLLGFFVPSVLNPFLGEWAKGFHFTYTNFATIGYAALVLRCRGRATQQTPALLGLVRPGLPGDHAGTPAAHQRPVHLRPGRAGGAVSAPLHPLPLHPAHQGESLSQPLHRDAGPLRGRAGRLGRCLAPGTGARLVLRRRPPDSAGADGSRALSFVAILGLVGFDSLSVPLPLSDLRAPAIYQQIRQEPGDFTVLELPLGWRNGFRVTGAANSAIMYEQFYQATSQKRMLGGNTSRNPEFKFDYFIQAPLIRSFIALEEKRPLPAGAEEADRRHGRGRAALLQRALRHRPSALHRQPTWRTTPGASCPWNRSTTRTACAPTG